MQPLEALLPLPQPMPNTPMSHALSPQEFIPFGLFWASWPKTFKGVLTDSGSVLPSFFNRVIASLAMLRATLA